MERHPIPGEKPKTPIFYIASSIHDMVSSREQVLTDFRDKISNIHEEPKPLEIRSKDGGIEFYFKLQMPEFIRPLAGKLASRKQDLSKPGSKALTSWEYRRAALVYIPLIRHFPEEDEQEHALTIRDITAECDIIRLPDNIEKRLDRHLRPNFPVLKNSAWASDVLLLNSYSSTGYDQFALFMVQNRSANQPQTDTIKSFVANLGFSPAT